MTSAKLLKSSVVFVIVQLIPISTWGLTQEQALKELEKQNIRFNRNGFVESAARGDMATVELFLSAGMKPNVRNREGRTALIQAVRGKHIAVVKTLLAEGAIVNAESRHEYDDEKTALMFAAQRGYGTIVRTLVAAGANVDAANNYGKTSLMFAAEFGNTGIVQTLLAKGASVEGDTMHGWTALLL